MDSRAEFRRWTSVSRRAQHFHKLSLNILNSFLLFLQIAVLLVLLTVQVKTFTASRSLFFGAQTTEHHDSSFEQ